VNIKGTIAILLTITVCAFVFGTEFFWLTGNYQVGDIPVESRKMASDLLTFMLGMVSGYLAGQGNNKND
jgi:hypothetical protein